MGASLTQTTGPGLSLLKEYNGDFRPTHRAKIDQKSKCPPVMTHTPHSVDVLVLGASAAGLMCAIEAAKRQRSVLVLDHANKPGKKILMSGGGRCNFTNYDVSADNYISTNPHFCKSALNRFTQWDFIQMAERHQISYHERDHGQLFCDDSARNILDMLLHECQQHNVTLQLNTSISDITLQDNGTFNIKTQHNDKVKKITCQSLVVATGGLSIPKMGASPMGYRIAEQFNINIIPTRAGLVPLTLHDKDKTHFSTLPGIAVNALVSTQQRQFRENILFTHRGLSGPAILQISSYWKPDETISINLLPDNSIEAILTAARKDFPTRKLKTILGQYLPKRLITTFVQQDLLEDPVQQITLQDIKNIHATLHNWSIKPNGTEGYRTAEVTLGGVDCNALSSKTMESNTIIGLYFIGEVIDVTGWLGGYNFQWAWSSGWCAGQYV